MTFGAALIDGWRRALVFAVVLTVVAFGLDMLTGREVDWQTRISTVVLGTAIYWVLSAWFTARRQG